MRINPELISFSKAAQKFSYLHNTGVCCGPWLSFILSWKLPLLKIRCKWGMGKTDFISPLKKTKQKQTTKKKNICNARHSLFAQWAHISLCCISRNELPQQPVWSHPEHICFPESCQFHFHTFFVIYISVKFHLSSSCLLPEANLEK